MKLAISFLSPHGIRTRERTLLGNLNAVSVGVKRWLEDANELVKSVDATRSSIEDLRTGKDETEEIEQPEKVRNCPECGEPVPGVCHKCGMTYGRGKWRQIGVYDG